MQLRQQLVAGSRWTGSGLALALALALICWAPAVVRSNSDGEYQSEVLSDTELGATGGSQQESLGGKGLDEGSRYKGSSSSDQSSSSSSSGGLMENLNSGLKGLLGGGVGLEAGVSKQSTGLTASKPEPPKDLFGELFFGKLGIFGDWLKLIFNPFELVKSIAGHFKLPFEKLLSKLGTGLVVGLEPLLYPLVFSIRIVEKIFVPDQCRLKFMCSMGVYLEFMREHVLKFSPNFLEGSSHLRALSEGIVGKSCQASFPDCEPKLKKPYEELAGASKQ